MAGNGEVGLGKEEIYISPRQVNCPIATFSYDTLPPPPNPHPIPLGELVYLTGPSPPPPHTQAL